MWLSPSSVQQLKADGKRQDERGSALFSALGSLQITGSWKGSKLMSSYSHKQRHRASLLMIKWYR